MNSKFAERMFGAKEVLVAAVKLTALPGIYVDEGVKSVSYYHLLFDQHEIVFAEGTQAESLLLGDQAKDSFSPDKVEELTTLFPDLMREDHGLQPARPLPRSNLQKRLVYRHSKNKKRAIALS